MVIVKKTKYHIWWFFIGWSYKSLLHCQWM